MRDARGWRTRQPLKSIYKLLFIGLNEYVVKSAPIGVYKCFLKADVYANLWHPAWEQEIFCQYMKNMFKFCIHSETLKTNFIEYV